MRIIKLVSSLFFGRVCGRCFRGVLVVVLDAFGRIVQALRITLVTAGGEMYEACRGCHQRYAQRLNNATEGVKDDNKDTANAPAADAAKK